MGKIKKIGIKDIGSNKQLETIKKDTFLYRRSIAGANVNKIHEITYQFSK